VKSKAKKEEEGSKKNFGQLGSWEGSS